MSCFCFLVSSNLNTSIGDGSFNLIARFHFCTNEELQRVPQASLCDGIGIVCLVQFGTIVGEVVSIGIGKFSIPIRSSEWIDLRELSESRWSSAFGRLGINIWTGFVT